MFFWKNNQVVAIRDIIPPPLRDSFNDVYIAYELMDTDLHQIIRSNQALSEEHCQVKSNSIAFYYLWYSQFLDCLFHWFVTFFYALLLI